MGPGGGRKLNTINEAAQGPEWGEPKVDFISGKAKLYERTRGVPQERGTWRFLIKKKSMGGGKGKRGEIKSL